MSDETINSCEHRSVPPSCQPEAARHSLRAPAATVELREPASPRLLPLRAGWQRLKAAAVWLDDSWVGDLIGAVCLFGSIYLFTLIAWALS